MKIALVTLNFLTYQDTFENIESLFLNIQNKEKIEFSIYIVDNQSDKNKLLKLQERLKQFNFNINYIASNDNLGFARGMNLGINKAREDGYEFIICSNNDIIYNTKINLNKLIKPYIDNFKIGVIGPNIKTLDGKSQNPYFKNIIDWNRYKTKLKNKLFFNYKIGYFLYYLYSLKNEILNKNTINRNVNVSECIYALHGAYFVLTPSYFKVFSGLDSNTFLFSEELILAERIKKAGLCEYFISEIEVLHKEDSSTNEFVFNKWDKLKFIIKENYKSRRYFFKEYIWK